MGRIFPLSMAVATLVLCVVLGFLPGALVFFLTFLRRKAQQPWGLTLALTACVIVVLAAAANLLLVELPGGLIAEYIDQPWLTGQVR